MAERREVVLVDAVRVPFGRAGEKGIYWQTRADDLVVKVIRALLKRNPKVKPEMVEENAWAATTQTGDQGLTIGRSAAILAGLPVTTPGFALDRMCAGAMTAVTTVASEIAMGSIEVGIAGGVEHMGHHPMGQGVDPNPRFLAERLVDPSALVMGETAENLHDAFPDITKEMADEYALLTQQKAFKAWVEGKLQRTMVPMTVWTREGWKVSDHDEQPRPDTSLEALAKLRPAFRPGGRVTAGNSSGLNDGAAGVLLMSEEKARELGVRPKMRLVAYAYAGVKPELMGLGPIPATEKALKIAGLSFDDLGIIEINEAFAVQVLVFMKHFGMKIPDDPRLNPWGGAIAFGHPLASSGARLMAQLAEEFAERPDVRYGLTTMCVGLGMGGSVIWENLQRSEPR